MLSDNELKELSSVFEHSHPEEILRWAIDTFGADVAASSSFQTQSLPLLHIVARTQPHLPVIFLDTGYHFPETLVFRDRLVQEWNLNLQVIRAAPTGDGSVYHQREALYRHDPDLCCYVNKVEPMQRAMAGLQAWVSGIRRDQTPVRANAQILERAPQGVVLVHPLATWSQRDVWSYIQEHDLPQHPLLEQGYLSVGCAPCTRPVSAGEDERAGRWAGLDKTECGLHTLLYEEAADHALQSVELARQRR
jgi:phosphoadenosine phosphosulfate reductase